MNHLCHKTSLSTFWQSLVPSGFDSLHPPEKGDERCAGARTSGPVGVVSAPLSVPDHQHQQDQVEHFMQGGWKRELVNFQVKDKKVLLPVLQ